jgi:hypothetical protein
MASHDQHAVNYITELHRIAIRADKKENETVDHYTFILNDMIDMLTSLKLSPRQHDILKDRIIMHHQIEEMQEYMLTYAKDGV